jgi:hypothetical protein
MLFAAPSSGRVNIMIRITGIGDQDRPEWGSSALLVQLVG